MSSKCPNPERLQLQVLGSECHQQGWRNLARKRARLAPIGTNLGFFLKISFLFILARRAKMNRKLILKSPRFVPFDANLGQLVV